MCKNINKYQMWGNDCYHLLSVYWGTGSTLNVLVVVAFAGCQWFLHTLMTLGFHACQPTLLGALTFSIEDFLWLWEPDQPLNEQFVWAESYYLPKSSPLSTVNKSWWIKIKNKNKKSLPNFPFCLQEVDHSILEWSKKWELSK